MTRRGRRGRGGRRGRRRLRWAGLLLVAAGACGVGWNAEVTYRAARIAKPRVPPLVLRPASRDYRVHTVAAATALAAIGLLLLARSLP